MAEEPETLMFQNNCEEEDIATDINNAKVSEETNEKIIDNDITSATETNTNKQGDEPKQADSECVPLDSMDLLSQEAAVEKFLAGDAKNEFSDELLLSTIDNDEEGIDFKQENELVDCEQLTKTDFEECGPSSVIVEEPKRKPASYDRGARWWLLRSLKKRRFKL